MPPSRPVWLSDSIRTRLTGLSDALSDENLAAFGEAVDRAARARLTRFLRGIDLYRRHPFRRAETRAPTVWHSGSARLLDYGPAGDAADRTAVLLVPSLVNRAYVLDLLPGRSMVEFLAHFEHARLRPLLLDWGAPGEAERAFNLSDYILRYLDAAFERARALSADGRVHIVGYCMGGLLVLPAALAHPEHIASLTLLATPWDFHAHNEKQAASVADAIKAWLPYFDALGEMPVDALQALFTSLDPYLALRKFERFAELEQDSEEAKHFVVLEDWLNDGVPLTAPVARECLVDWYGDNVTAKGSWRVGGRAVVPEEVRVPTFVVTPDADRIVPPPSAMALASSIPDARIHTPRAGHIGMVAGSRARAEVYEPVAAWLAARSEPGLRARTK
ncbi:MAG: alpha/beta fold hydrolase [Alphaproteobacteria bacterium]